ncbi:hypothetical protein [Sphingobacterium suaedae]|uniref:SbsA Ig-like domain-containing protein n=1 Tax=Sphingobacterium suaedae TaxID=1686402 RepID=A0ABW5KP22_9SPHI
MFTTIPGQRTIKTLAVLHDTLRLYVDRPLEADQSYDLQIRNLLYCNNPQDIDLPLFRPSPSTFNDIVINEILFNPPTGGVDFVELFNRSSKTSIFSTGDLVTASLRRSLR